MTGPKVGRSARTTARVVGFVGVVLLVLSARVLVGASGELKEGELLESRGEIDIAAVHYRRAAAWYLPINPYADEALRRLVDLAETAEQQDDLDRVLLAWRSVRAAILSTRSFYTPNAGLLDIANERIADAMASLDPPPIDRGKGREQVRSEHLALLRDVERPAVGWTIVLLLGFIGWTTGAWMFLLRAIDEEDRLIGRPARVWGTVVIVGLGLFALGLSLA